MIILQKRDICVMGLAVCFIFICTGAVWGVDILEPGYIAQTYATYSDAGVSMRPDKMIFAGDGNLYVTQKDEYSVWRIEPDGTASRFVSGLGDQHGMGIEWGEGTGFGSYLYVAADGKIYRIGLDGTKTTFATRYCAGPLGLDRSGNYGGTLYTTEGCIDQTYSISTSGSVTRFTSWPGWNDGGGPAEVCIDSTGRYGGLMYVATYYIESKSQISGLFVITPSKSVSRFSNDLVMAHCIGIDPGDEFGGDMFVVGTTVYGQDESIWRVSPEGAATEFAKVMTSIHPCITFGPDGAMYVGDYDDAKGQAVISRITSGVLTGLEIVGSDEAAEHSQTPYQAIAHYDNGGTRDVTALASWTVMDGGLCSIADGVLSAGSIDLPEVVMIRADYSEMDNQQTAEKDVALYALCPSGSALAFDGENDYVRVPYTASMQAPVFTVCAWVNPNRDLSSGGNANIVGRGEDASSDNAALIFAVNPLGSSWGEGLKINWEDRTDGDYAYGSHYFPPSGQWTHVAATRAPDGTATLYANGEVVGQWTSTPVPTNRCYQDITIGATSLHTSSVAIVDYFPGKIDEVGLYNRALTQDEIQAVMNDRPDTSDPALIGYWNFDEGQSQVAGDASDNANNGQLGAMTVEDDSDPAWVESEVPIHICSAEEIIERNLSGIMNRKFELLEQLSEIMVQEGALGDYMEELFRDRDFSEINKNDLVKSKQKLHSAVQHEEQAEEAIDKSLDKLDDAMEALDMVPDEE